MGYELSNRGQIKIKMANYSLTPVGFNFPKNYDFTSRQDTYDRNGWTQNNLISTPETGSTWNFTTASMGTPSLSSPSISVNAKRFPKVILKMKAINGLTPNSKIVLSWNGTSGTGSQAIPITSINTEEYLFEMTTNANWSGKITNLRFDFVGMNQANLAFEGLQFD